VNWTPSLPADLRPPGCARRDGRYSQTMPDGGSASSDQRRLRMITPRDRAQIFPRLTQELYHPFAVASIFSCYADGHPRSHWREHRAISMIMSNVCPNDASCWDSRRSDRYCRGL
jgi:hypothetical protein